MHSSLYVSATTSALLARLSLIVFPLTHFYEREGNLIFAVSTSPVSVKQPTMTNIPKEQGTETQVVRCVQEAQHLTKIGPLLPGQN